MFYFRKFSDLMGPTSLTTYQIACFAIQKLAERLEDTYQCTILLLIVIKEKKRWYKIIISFEKIKLMQQLQKKGLMSLTTYQITLSCDS